MHPAHEARMGVAYRERRDQGLVVVQHRRQIAGTARQRLHEPGADIVGRAPPDRSLADALQMVDGVVQRAAGVVAEALPVGGIEALPGFGRGQGQPLARSAAQASNRRSRSASRGAKPVAAAPVIIGMLAQTLSALR